MRISELSSATGVPIATIKYYLREGLLHEGRRTSATQARYDDSHIARLRLVRALTDVGNLSVHATRQVLAQLDAPPPSLHDLLGAAQLALAPPTDDDVDIAAATSIIRAMGWHVRDSDAEAVRRLARALAAFDAAEFPIEKEQVLRYARAVDGLARGEVAGVPEESAEAVRYVVLGTVLAEPLLLALRRIAEISASAERYDIEGSAG